MYVCVCARDNFLEKKNQEEEEKSNHKLIRRLNKMVLNEIAMKTSHSRHVAFVFVFYVFNIFIRLPMVLI